MAYFLTADGGTESLRARIYDLSGTCIASHAEAYETVFSPGARAEQNPEHWWACLCKATRACLAEAGLSGNQIEAMAYATTCCTVVALDPAGQPLRPAIMWMDVRADHEAGAVLATGDARLKLNSDGAGPVSAEWMIPKALWIKRNEPDIYAAAATICEYQDYLTLRLTGERCASLNNVGLRWHYANRDGGWAESLVSALDMADLVDKWPARVAAPGEVVGHLTAEAAAALGLTTRTKLVQGGADALIGMIGLGVSKPGQLCLITGSSHLQFGVTEKPFYAPGMWGAYADILYPDRFIIEGGQTSTGSIINWLRRFVGGELDFETMNRKAAELSPGSDGLIVQDHFQGNRTPYTDAQSRGAIAGLTLAHEPHHVFRAVMEGIAMGTRAILDAFAKGGYQGTEMIAGGGATNSDLFMQIHADTAGMPLRIPASTDGPSLGSAILAAHGAGHFDTIDDGIEAMVKPGRVIDPNPQAVVAYEEIYARYTALYPALKNAFER
ncbi:carbohydrate kinase [Tateyamaria omphalii]|uniref:FGGY-family carbohydrate kinase n=1 Tax=Tateyamaria omphalii TaxID=299262 RepID=UPI001C9A054B|nr:FGGY-family carbohydrate kinase [Tateyamaria omphalii]MBY5934918.1 carbohydrate kinase [Tateyamaria omphalii]